jgi:NAD(P)H-hydrate epimerase
MRQVEQDCANIGLPSDKLMENAGKAFAEEVRNILGSIKKQSILMLIGPGNNGGDGLVAARHFHDWGAKVTLLLFGDRAPDDQNFALVQERGIDCLGTTEAENPDKLESLITSSNAVIDALFGIGTIRPFHDTLKSALDKISDEKRNRPLLRIIALDLPSGLNADTGAVDPACLYADNTITLGLPKTGLLKAPGIERAGRITVADIGIPAYLVDEITDEMVDKELARSLLPPRPLQANKGTFGRALIIAGSINYIGAAYLASSGALRVGTGLVTLATATSLQPILASKLTEATYFPLPEAQRGIISPSAARLIHQSLNSYNTLLLGCGLGQTRPAVEFVENTLLRARAIPLPLVLDADALNSLARIPNWWQRLTDDAILTPHPGEMARLTGMSVAEVQADRSGVAKRAAAAWNKTVVLKGAYTLIATADGRTRTCPTANPGLASAGTGDVLSGVIAGLSAQGLSLFDAASLGVFLHSEAAEMVRSQLGDSGMLASDLLPLLPLVIKQLKEGS